MDPFNNANTTPQMPTMPQIPDDAQSGHKKKMLQQLIGKAMGSGGAGIHETINSIKSALGAYKNYAKEWDNLAQSAPTSARAAADPVGAAMGNGVGGGKPQQPTMSPPPQPATSAPMPQTPPVQHPQPPTPPPMPQMPKVNMPSPQQPQQPVVPQHPLIASPMPSFMGGGNPPQTRF